MENLRSVIVAGLLGGAALAAPTMTIAQTPEPKGPTAKPLLNLQLAPELSSVEGRVLRMS